MAQNLKINDKVKIISGDNKGTEAKIVKIDRRAGKAMLEGIGLVERHMRKSYLNPAGGKKTVHVGIDLSNLSLVEAATYDKTAAKKADKKKNPFHGKIAFVYTKIRIYSDISRVLQHVRGSDPLGKRSLSSAPYDF